VFVLVALINHKHQTSNNKQQKERNETKRNETKNDTRMKLVACSSAKLLLLSAMVSTVAVMMTTAPMTVSGQITRQECTDTFGGTIVGDIGNGAIFSPNYRCEQSNEPPIDVVVPAEGEPIASEGEVCCPSATTSSDSFPPPSNGGDGTITDTDRPEVTRDECTGEDINGVVQGDIGDGATRRDDYICESNGQPPVANIVPAEGEPIAIEGEVCCGTSNATGASTTTEPTASPTPLPPVATSEPPSSAPSYFHQSTLGWTAVTVMVMSSSVASLINV